MCWTNGRAEDLPGIPLEDDDRLYVPSPPSMASVFGAVFTESSFLYRPEKRTNDYLTHAGGTTKRADIAVSAGKALSGAQRFRLIGDPAAAAGRPVDLLDLRTARGVGFARALRGRELFCDSVRATGEVWYRRASLIEDDPEAASVKGNSNFPSCGN